MKKLTYKHVKEYIESFGFVLLSDKYINSKHKLKILCPNNHKFQMRFNDFKTGKRCAECAGLKKHTIEFIKEYGLKYNYICISNIYVNCMTKLIWKCPKNHTIKMHFNSFKNGNRCKICYDEENYGEKNYNWNPNREEIKLNLRLRKNFSKTWIKNNMKHDLNYNNFFNNKESYHIDHKIPIKAFCDFLIKYPNFDEKRIREILNHKRNMQLLTELENRKKWCHYNKIEVMEYIRKYY